jgi:hypothetical protein
MSYVLPIKRGRDGTAADAKTAELVAYLTWLTTELDDVIVVDGSPPDVFDNLSGVLPPVLRHLPPDAPGRSAMGKVDGVLTGLRHATEDRVLIADEDVRYDGEALRRMFTLLETADIVRPQNYFSPAPWHALWDTSRSLLNRLTGGDWPGTMGVRRSVAMKQGGYDGDVMFENLELERTVLAAGGRATVPLDLYVRRLPPSTGQFLSQRVRQAYDELARPRRLLIQLMILPATLVVRRNPLALAVAAAGVVVAAEAGRRRAGGTRYFSPFASLVAPLWLLERGVCAWLALGAQLMFGGIPYRGRIVPRAANSMSTLRRRMIAAQAA